MGRCSLVRLGRGAKTSDMSEDHRDGEERHEDWKECARMPEDVRTDSFSVHDRLAGLMPTPIEGKKIAVNSITFMVAESCGRVTGSRPVLGAAFHKARAAPGDLRRQFRFV